MKKFKMTTQRNHFSPLCASIIWSISLNHQLKKFQTLRSGRIGSRSLIFITFKTSNNLLYETSGYYLLLHVLGKMRTWYGHYISVASIYWWPKELQNDISLPHPKKSSLKNIVVNECPPSLSIIYIRPGNLILSVRHLCTGRTWSLLSPDVLDHWTIRRFEFLKWTRPLYCQNLPYTFHVRQDHLDLAVLFKRYFINNLTIIF